MFHHDVAHAAEQFSAAFVQNIRERLAQSSAVIFLGNVRCSCRECLRRHDQKLKFGDIAVIGQKCKVAQNSWGL